MTADEELAMFNQMQDDIDSKALRIGTVGILIVGHTGRYDSFENLYGKKCTVEWISEDPDDEDEVLKVRFGPDGDERTVGVFFSEFRYVRKGQNPLESHFRELIADVGE